ncbi:probable RNA polymerase II nuclear localization protein SLC7A6OS [Galleria mellonella]|uniref:Probable RNA polymerase II nuclear localization protein SLC7A6OS n=1 Tax=Galleria mellonella TaxID=7137 RepID=A0ABM3N314_GALME|nr:probable RNA polymerase II nuclear localization protein SLC7A6OS [Galleria mellonella]
MTTSTVLRVKRRLEDNPQDALVIMCKRMKTQTEELSPSLFVFRGTVNTQEPINVKDITPKSDVKLKPTHDVSEIIDKIRKERKDVSSQSRYEVVNCSRGLKENNNVDSDQLYHLVDLEKADTKENDVKYAYDLYIAAKQDFDVSMLDNIVSIEDYETDLIFGSHRDNGRRSPSTDNDDDEDDSNDENNWRNDYPDSEPSSIDEEDMIRAVERCDLDDDLSSDTGEDKIYDEPPDIFNEDVKRYGAAYAKYKAKVLSEDPDLANSRGLVHSAKIKELDDNNGYKDDSDDGFYYGQDEDTEQYREQYGSDISESD